jgi:protein gp37
MGQAKYQTDGDPRTSGPGFGLTVHSAALRQPYTWGGHRVVFVNSMSDLFHARVPLDFVRQVFAVIADTPQHTYQVLTKRSARLPKIAATLDWPPNLWMGVSIEHADTLVRADHLRAVPAAVRFLSCEPLLGPLDGLKVDGIDWVIAGASPGRITGRSMRPGSPRSGMHASARECRSSSSFSALRGTPAQGS